MATVAQEDAASRVRTWLYDFEDRLNRMALDLREHPELIESREFLQYLQALGQELLSVPGGDMAQVVLYASTHSGEVRT